MTDDNPGYFNLELPENKPSPKKNSGKMPLLVKIIIGILIAGAVIVFLPIIFCMFVGLIGGF